MNIVIKKEIDNYDEMVKYISDNNLIDVKYRFAVVALLTDKNGKVILQRRGPKARDNDNILADIGGAFELSDKSFRDAMLREIREEVGNDALIEIEHFVSGSLKTIYNPEVGEDVNWLFLSYKCKYNGGELLINEPGKCRGYEYYGMDELPDTDRAETSKFFWDYYLNRYNKCYSYAMGINKKINKLNKEFKCKEDGEDFEVTFNNSNENLWVKFIEDNMSDGFWNEYLIDDKIKFIFKEDGIVTKYELNKDNNQEILEKCRRFAEVQFESVRSMYLNTPFYSNKIDGIIFFD